MKKIFFILLSLTLLNQKVFAITLSEALLQAYTYNPELNAERENINISKEDLNISKSDFDINNYSYISNFQINWENRLKELNILRNKSSEQV